jgi:predicted HicB family RNase H-like nuclease
MAAFSTTDTLGRTKRVDGERASIVVDGAVHRAAKLTALQLGMTLGGYVAQLLQADIAKRGTAQRARR